MTTLRRSIPLLSACALILFTSGCTNTYPKETNYGLVQQRKESHNQSRAYQTEQQAHSIIHNNRAMAYDHNLSNQIAAMHGVMGAIVMRTENNAYVAVMLDRAAAGTKSGGNERFTRGPLDPKNNMPQPYYQNLYTNELATDFLGYDTVKDHRNLSHVFKQRIAEKIRAADPQVHDVYISANRNFINQLNAYKLYSAAGASLQPYISEFNKSVTQIFGTEKLP
ncbi:hypothetical protein [Paenibacillus sp. FJAT-26967]|uniref:hypothetical protein n=1 Tax=Paenibacillus sp. FJAT-26967 TaxID=1729690 RepID=UPI000839A8CF|nr:hypothetical protein [Paenibacillus sp. FJAT-26967]